MKTLEVLVREIAPDGIFLNSLFSKPTLTLLAARRFKGSIPIPVILAPCGELSSGALSIKPWKKRVFLKLAKALGLYANVDWKASTPLESEEIRRAFGKKISAPVAPDLPPKDILPYFSLNNKPSKELGKVKFIYYSRIDPKKNLLFVLELFSNAKLSGSVEFMIVGPIEDEAYWRKCQEQIAKLPAEVTVDVIGPVSQGEGLEILVSCHFMILPTLGENFGYVILESLAAGCPVLTSDRTMWAEVPRRNAGWATSLDDFAKWRDLIQHCIDMNNGEYISMSTVARRIAIEWLESPDVELATEKLLKEVIGV
jgi:glycosyltransferase involved in cell wall biosynthesis